MITASHVPQSVIQSLKTAALPEVNMPPVPGMQIPPTGNWQGVGPTPQTFNVDITRNANGSYSAALGGGVNITLENDPADGRVVRNGAGQNIGVWTCQSTTAGDRLGIVINGRQARVATFERRP